MTAICLAFNISIAGSAKGESMNANDLILIPEPKLSRFAFGGYELDKAATLSHYDRLFHGKTAEQVVRFLEDRGKKVQYSENSNEISIMHERLVTFFYYRVGMSFTFQNGIFEKAEIWSYGVK